MMGEALHYTKNHEILVNEQFGWIPHCAVYRERARQASSSRPWRSGTASSFATGSVDYISRSDYMLDRSNSDRRKMPDFGGNLTHKKYYHYRQGWDIQATRSSDGFSYRGPLFPTVIGGFSNVTVAPSQPSEGFFSTQGASLVSKALPTLPSSGLGVFVAELRDGLPSMMLHTLKSLKGLSRGAADDFLNFQFGWKPLIADLQDLVKVLRNHNEIIRQYARDSGRPIRRRRALPPAFTTTVDGGSLSASLAPNISTVASTFVGTQGSRTVTNRVETWFSGEFKYFIPVGDSVLERLERFELMSHKLFEVGLSPQLLWEAAPWSWLVDWVTNVGDVMKNVTAMARYGTVMSYGYVMHNIQVRSRLECTLGISASGFTWTSPPRGSAYVESVWEHRYRRKANPYGFGITWEGLSNLQLAILAALGLSRGHRPD